MQAGKKFVSEWRRFLGSLAIYPLLATIVFSCSSAREAGETTDSPTETTVPADNIQSDKERQQIYNQGNGVRPANENPIERSAAINEKASSGNNKKNIEEPGPDKPALKPTEVRPQGIKPRTDTISR